jgi:hypothetical protein
VFALLDNANYAMANIKNLHILRYHRQHDDLPFADMIKNDVGLYSEEAGEVSFACLARSVQGAYVSDKLKHTRTSYQTIGIFHKMRDLLEPSTRGDIRRLERSRIPKCGEDVRTVEMFFKLKLRELKAGAFMWYASPRAFKKDGVDARQCTDAVIPISMQEKR